MSPEPGATEDGDRIGVVRRDWCVVVRPAPTASADQVRQLAAFFKSSGREFDWEREASDFLVLVADQRNLDRAEEALMARLARLDLASAVVTPCPFGRWDTSLARYLIASEPRVAPDPVVRADEIRWLVAVRPASAFDWLAMRAALTARGRTTLREIGQTIEVGARDEDDALDLMAELSEVPAIGVAEAEQLGWFRRWRVRQQLLGNYSDFADPALPP